jgi:hypothetical protein
MAKAISHKITTTDKLTLKGVLNDDATIITVIDEKNEIEKKLEDYLKLFAGKAVEIAIAEKSEEEVE